MPAAKPSSPRPSPTRLPSLATLVAVVPGLAPGLLAQGLLALGLMALGFALGLGLLSTDATAQTRATLKVPPEPAGNTILVLDYSNSMWGQIDEVAKIEIARDIIERNLADWNQSTRLGLVAYGHRRKSDCSDIELVAAPAAQATDAMLAFLADAAPRGRTPLTSALEQAARHATDGADSESGSASLVLLTDGIESCGRDPCAAVTDLDAAGVALAVHVIGLDLDGPEAEELRCIADITGGQFLTADDAKALDAALVDTLAQPASVVLPTPRRGAETTAPVPEAVAEAEAEAEAAPVPTTEDTVKALLAEAASMRDELAALQDQMDERERRLLSAQAALSDKLADMTAKLNRSRLAGDRLRAENEQLKAAIRSLLDLSDQAAALAGDVLAPATAAAAANEARRERASKAPVADTPAAIPLAPTPETLGPPIPGDVVRISLAPGSEIPLDEL
ncbi:MAG: vWA domain-containing protein, partial [Pseudomonadota bacterium]|nr:vWA domain-containing protein [Pseudomonadota bacterium]